MCNLSRLLFAGLIIIVFQALPPGALPALAAPRPAARPKHPATASAGKAVVAWLVPKFDFQDCVNQKPPLPEQNFVPKVIDLNADGTPEVVVKGERCLCSVTGNCWLGIYRRGKGGYEELLDAGITQTYHFLSSRSHGYRDLVTTMHGSAYDSVVFLFRFDGRRYRLRECYDRTYLVLDSKDIQHFLLKPKFTRTSCEGYAEELGESPDPGAAPGG